MSEIASGRCPYCGGPYSVYYAGCRYDCPGWRAHARLVADAASADPGVDVEADYMRDCAHDWQEQPVEPPRDVCSKCGKEEW